MLVEIRSLSEGELASCFGALEWPLFRVHPQMIEKVVPFAEHHSTEGAFEYLDTAFCGGILIAVDKEVPSARYFPLVDSKAIQIEVAPRDDLYSDVGRHLLAHSKIRNLVGGHEGSCDRLVLLFSNAYLGSRVGRIVDDGIAWLIVIPSRVGLSS